MSTASAPSSRGHGAVPDASPGTVDLVRPVGVEACCTPASTAGSALDAEEAGRLAARLKALADPNRLRLLSLLAADPRGEACVCDLTEPLGLGQPTVSHHVKVLVDAGLVTRRRRGSWTWCAVVPERLEEIAESLGGLLEPADSPALVAGSA